MGFIPAPNIVQVEIRAIKQLQKIENRIHVNCLHTPTVDDFVAINAAVATTIATNWITNLPGDVTINSLFYRSLENINGPQLEVPLSSNHIGLVGGDPEANYETLCVSLRSASGGRSARGRLYWLGLSEQQTLTNVVNNADVITIVGAVEALRANLAAINRPLTIVSYRSNGIARPGGPVYFTVTNVLAVDNVLDSQKRRMPGHGT